MKILFYNWRDVTHPLGGGAELYIHELAKRLAQNHEVFLYTGKYKGCKGREKLDGVEIIRRGGAFSVYIYAILDYLLWLRKENFDIIVDSVNCVPFFTPLFIRKPKVALVYHIVKMATIRQELPLPAALVAWVAQRLIPFLYRRVPFITISESSREELAHFGIPRDHLGIVYCGVNHTPLAPGEKSPKPLIAYIGVLKKYKQLEHLLMALPAIRQEVPETELLIAGKRDYNGRLEAIAKSLELDHCLHLVGQVTEEEKVRILQRAWLFATCSVKEGWGINVIEANACGTPAIAYDVPGLRDSIRNEETGLLVPFERIKELSQAMVRLLKDTALRQRLGQGATEWAANFTWDKSARDFAQALEKAIERKGNGL